MPVDGQTPGRNDADSSARIVGAPNGAYSIRLAKPESDIFFHSETVQVTNKWPCLARPLYMYVSACPTIILNGGSTGRRCKDPELACRRRVDRAVRARSPYSQVPCEGSVHFPTRDCRGRSTVRVRRSASNGCTGASSSMFFPTCS